MGKMKRARQKLHNAAKKANSKPKTDQEVDEMDAVPADPTSLGLRGDNLFAGLNIQTEALKQKLPDFDARSTITSKTFKGKNMTKKEKMKLRREAFMAKMNMAELAKKENKQKKKEKKKKPTAVVGDMSSMLDALPTLELLLKGNRKGSKAQEKPRSVMKESKRKKQMADDISIFGKVLKHPAFKADAAATIKEHLKIKLEKERESNMES